MQPNAEMPVVVKPLGIRLRVVFFGGCVAMLTFIIVGTFYLYEMIPGNSEEECRYQCAGSKNPAACQNFCNCIYQQGKPLDSCLAAFNKAKDTRKAGGR